eukprot:1154054-Pelagomonas_calceolata.AAC.4
MQHTFVLEHVQSIMIGDCKSGPRTSEYQGEKRCQVASSLSYGTQMKLHRALVVEQHRALVTMARRSKPYKYIMLGMNVFQVKLRAG